MVSPNPAWGGLVDELERAYDDAVVYADREGDDVLYRGDCRLLANGWLELPSGRLLSPDAVHHVDPGP